MVVAGQALRDEAASQGRVRHSLSSSLALLLILPFDCCSMLRKGQEGHVRAERDLLATAATSTRWTVRLAYSFQDVDCLYLVMSFMSGGGACVLLPLRECGLMACWADLLTLLIEKDVFEESFAKFYISEMVLAVEETHKVLGAIHRDVSFSAAVDEEQMANPLRRRSSPTTFSLTRTATSPLATTASPPTFVLPLAPPLVSLTHSNAVPLGSRRSVLRTTAARAPPQARDRPRGWEPCACDDEIRSGHDAWVGRGAWEYLDVAGQE